MPLSLSFLENVSSVRQDAMISVTFFVSTWHAHTKERLVAKESHPIQIYVKGTSPHPVQEFLLTQGVMHRSIYV